MAAQNSSSAPTPPARIPPVPPQITKPKASGPASAAEKRPPSKRFIDVGSLPFWAGLVFSAVWVGIVLIIVAGSGPAHVFGGLPLVDWAIGISAIVSPVALIWMIAAYMQRAADIKSVADPLRRQLSIITGESGAAEARIRRFNGAIREQIELLKNAQGMSQNDLAGIMNRVRQHRDELERFEHASIQQVKEIQEIVRRNMQQVEQLMDDKFTMLRVLDGKLVQNGDAVARQTEAVRDQVAGLLEEIESHSQTVADALEHATQDSKKLADVSRAQESTLINATENAAETLNNLSGKIDLSVARFLERAGTAREEAERLAGALDAQTRSLDEFSNNLPARVGEAESVIRGVADRLYASEQLAREQAVSLSEKLSAQVDGLQAFMDRFTARLSDIDGGLEKRRIDLDSLAGRIGDTTSEFVSAWEKSIFDLNDRTNDTLVRFTSLNDESRKSAATVAQELNAVTGKYEDAATRMNKLSEDSNAQMKSMTAEIASHLEQFEALGEASRKAGAEVEGRASAAMQNLQYVLERLLTAREATQSVGDTLVKDLYNAVDQNEQLVTRLNEAAQMSVRALGIATESLGKQEGELADRTRVAEATLKEAALQLQQQAEVAEQGLRQQAQGLMGLLTETQAHMSATEQKLQSLATTAVAPVQDAIKAIDGSAEQGLSSMSRYSDGLQGQLSHLQQFHARVGTMGEDLTRVTTETLGTIDDLNKRFIAVRTMQEDSARQTLAQFADLSDRLQREVAGLDGQTGQAVESLQRAAAAVGEQSYQLLQNAENSGAKMQLVTSALQNEATQIRSILQKQADDLGADLSRAEKQFTTLGDVLKQRTDTAYSLLDRVAAHYNETTRAAAQDLDARTERLEEATGSVQAKTEAMTAALTQQLTALTGGVTQLDAQSIQINTASGKALQQLSSLNEKMTLTGETANANARQIVTRLEESGTAFLRQSNALAEAAQNSATLIQKAGGAFGEQAGKLLDSSHHIDQNLRQLTAATSTFAEQAAQIRNAMEQQNQRLTTAITETVTQLETVGYKLEQTASTAAITADEASTRFNELTNSASTRLGVAQNDMQSIATKAETMLTSLGSNITQQAGSLSVISEQLNEQYRTLTAANDSQRTQLVDLFDKLGSAHGQASEVADRTIARLADSVAQIQRDLGALSDQSQSAVGNVRAASAGFADQSVTLLQNAQAAEQQARTVLTVTASLQEQARQLREAMQDESTRAGDMLGALLSKLSASGVELRDISSATDTTLNGLNTNITQQSQALNGTMQQISDRQRSLTSALDAQRDVLNGLLNRLTLAQDETASMAERTAARLTDGAQQIVRQTETIGTQAQTTLANVQAANAAFATESGQLIQNAQGAEQQARTVLSVTTALQDQARQLREALHGEGERAGDMLSSLISRLTSGGVELREFSSATEMSLHSLNNGVAQQSQGLNAVMQQIIDRQRTLTTALDAQRDVLNGLLSRLNLAQDETASVAERTAARLVDGAQQVSRQAEIIEAQAQNALVSVQSAGAGFADQAGALGLQTQQAEQQMRGILSVTAGLQEQARQLREAMQAETSHAVEQLNATIAHLDNTNNHLKAQSGTAIQAMDQTALQFATLAHTSAEAMNRQAELLRGAAQTAEDRMAEAGAKMSDQMKLVSEAGGQAEAQARQLADVAEYATTRLVTLRETITDSDRDGQTVLASTTQRINDVKATLQTELHRLAELSQQAVEQVLSASQGLTVQSDTLRANLAMSESALSQAADMVREESLQLPATLDRSAAQIENATKQLKAQTEDADNTLVGTADRFITVTMTARESMVDEMRRVSTTAEQADKILTQFSSSLSEQMSAIKQNTAQLSEEQLVLVTKASESVAQLSAASDRLAHLRSDAAQTAEKLAKEFDTLDQRATSTGSRLVQTSETLAKNVDALSLVTQRAETQMMGASSQFRDQLERIRTGLQGQIDDINRGLMQITAQLERTGNTLRSTTAGTVADVERISQRFDQTSKDAATQLTDKTARMRGATEEVASLLTGFGDQLDVLLDRLAMAGDGIRRQEGGVVEQLQQALSHLSTVAEKLEAGRALATNVSEQTATRLTEVVETVQREMSNLTNGTQAAAGIMRGIGQIYGEQSQTLNTGVRDAHSQVIAMNKSVDEMQQRTDRMRVSLKLQSEELMNSLSQILRQLSTTGDVLGETVDQVLRDQAAESLKKIG